MVSKEGVTRQARMLLSNASKFEPLQRTKHGLYSAKPWGHHFHLDFKEWDHSVKPQAQQFRRAMGT